MIRPNILLLGVGHSGTTVVTRMLFAFGWEVNDADKPYAECNACRRVNAQYLQSGGITFDSIAAKHALRALHAPWVLKDPRYVITLPHWLPLFDSIPLLLWVKRDLSRVKQSYLRRGLLLPSNDPGLYGHTVDQLFNLAATHFAAWPGPKFDICYEHLADAVKLFDSSHHA